MLAQTKDVVRVGKSPHKQRGTKGNDVKKTTKTNYCFQGVFTRNSIRMGENLGFKMSPAHPAGSQQRPQRCRSACAIVGLTQMASNAPVRFCLGRLSDLTSLPLHCKRRGHEYNRIEDSKERQV